MSFTRVGVQVVCWANGRITLLVILGVTLRCIKIEKFDESLEKFFLAHTRLLILEWCGEVPVFPTINFVKDWMASTLNGAFLE